MTQQLPLFPDLPAGSPARDKPRPSHTSLRQAVEAYLPTVTDLPAAERPRARLEAYGSGALATAELLAVLLGTPHQITDAFQVERDERIAVDHSLRLIGRHELGRVVA